jgi:hypothetical protein
MPEEKEWKTRKDRIDKKLKALNSASGKSHQCD